jgi:hypothetical protein
MDVDFPIFVREKDSGDIERFDSVYQMQRHLERIDIDNAEYEAWDASGTKIRLQVQEPVWLCMTRETGPVHDELRPILVQYASQHGIDIAGLERRTFAELVDRVTKAPESRRSIRKK